MNRRVPVRLLVWVCLVVAMGLVLRFAYVMITRNCESDSEPIGMAIDATICADYGRPPFAYKRGDPVYVTFTLRNHSNQRVVLRSRDGSPAVDVDLHGMLWSASPSGKITPQLELAPGQTFTINWQILHPEDLIPLVPTYPMGATGLWADSSVGVARGRTVHFTYGR